VRCFVLDLPFTESVWITAVRFDPDQTSGVHHMAAGTAVSTETAKARALDAEVDADGTDRPGYECAGGFGVTVSSLLGVDGAASEGQRLPAGTGIFVPAGSTLLLSMHYWTPGVKAPDRSGVELWMAHDPQPLRPMSPWVIAAPADLPCPTGVSEDPADPCSREAGIERVDGFEPPITRAFNDLVFRHCNTTLEDEYQTLDFTDELPDHFYIHSQCDMTVPYDADLRSLHPHMHTRGASAKMEVSRGGGDFTTLIDIPRWDWHWESTYVLQQPERVRVGDRLRLECVFDNGLVAQPIDDRDPHYVVAGEGRYDDMCLGFLSYTRPAPAGAPAGSLCEEAHDLYTADCPSQTALADLIWPAGSCDDNHEQWAVGYLMSSPDIVQDYWCNPEPPAGEGASCSETLQCAFAPDCALQPDCTQGCLDAGSARARYRFDHYMECATRECEGLLGYDWWYCSLVACTGQIESCNADGTP
jgi:copper type II ascorbate-dependent monooxygenase-like protein